MPGGTIDYPTPLAFSLYSGVDPQRRRKRLGTEVYHADVDPKGRADLVVWKRAKL